RWYGGLRDRLTANRKRFDTCAAAGGRPGRTARRNGRAAGLAHFVGWPSELGRRHSQAGRDRDVGAVGPRPGAGWIIGNQRDGLRPRTPVELRRVGLRG